MIKNGRLTKIRRPFFYREIERLKSEKRVIYLLTALT